MGVYFRRGGFDKGVSAAFGRGGGVGEEINVKEIRFEDFLIFH